MFFCTDLHGSDVCFKKFVNAADFYGTQILIMGGDVTGKMVVPIAKQSSGCLSDVVRRREPRVHL